MGATQTLKESIQAQALASFDTAAYVGFGSDNTVESPAQTDLIVPVIRKAFDEVSLKNDSLGTYEFSAIAGLTEANGETLQEAGLFVEAADGAMFLRKLLTTGITKTASKEVSIGIKVTITVTDS
jgi:hypothetical protein